MNELALTSLESLDVKFTKPSIVYDLTKLKEDAGTIKQQCKDFFIKNESDYKVAKQNRKSLDDSVKALSRKRIDTVSEITSTVDDFKDDVVAVEKGLTAQQEKVDKEIKDYEKRFKEKKKAEILLYPGWADYMVFNETWLNRSVSKPQIEFELSEQKAKFKVSCEAIKTTCTICELDTAKYFDLLSKGTELNSIIELIKNDRAVKQQYTNVSSAPSVAPKEIIIDTDSDIYTRTYKIKGTKQQLKLVYDYMQTVGVIILEKS